MLLVTLIRQMFECYHYLTGPHCCLNGRKLQYLEREQIPQAQAPQQAASLRLLLAPPPRRRRHRATRARVSCSAPSKPGTKGSAFPLLPFTPCCRLTGFPFPSLLQFLVSGAAAGAIPTTSLGLSCQIQLLNHRRTAQVPQFVPFSFLLI